MAASPSPLTSRSRDDFDEGAEAFDQLLGERLHVTLRDAAKQDQFEQLVIADRADAGLQQSLPQPLAMAVEMGRAFRKLCRRFRLVAASHERHPPPGRAAAPRCRMPGLA
jgi:hypothetical protein